MRSASPVSTVPISDRCADISPSRFSRDSSAVSARVSRSRRFRSVRGNGEGNSFPIQPRTPSTAYNGVRIAEATRNAGAISPIPEKPPAAIDQTIPPAADRAIAPTGEN